MKYLWILDAGHGGMIDGNYQTKGKRSPKWPDGRQLFEGEFNRDVVNRIAALCEGNCIDYHILVPEQEDISLGERVRRANRLHKNQKCIYVSIHANAGGGTGWEVFTSPGDTKADPIATVFAKKAAASFPDFRMRKDLSDDDPDKEASFYVLKHTRMPAILTENFFMDRLSPDCELLFSHSGRQQIAQMHFDAISAIESNL